MTLLGSVFAIATALWPTSYAGDLRYESSEFAKSAFYSNPDTVAIDMLPSGVYGANKAFEKGGGPWSIENQRWGAEAIIAGIVTDDVEAIDRGFRIFEWGFARQQPDGSFANRNPFHSGAFFVEAVARAILQLENSKYRQDFASRISAIKPKLALAAQWMLRPEIEKEWLQKDQRFTHRFYLNAAATGIAGHLLRDEALRTKGRQYIERGLSLQDESGFNPEGGGSDTGYQALGLVYAARYYSIEADERLRPRLAAMAAAGTRWLSMRIRADGSVDSSANTRTGEHGEIGQDGRVKTTPYYSISRCLAYWGLILEEPSLVAAAEKVIAYQASRSVPDPQHRR